MIKVRQIFITLKYALHSPYYYWCLETHFTQTGTQTYKFSNAKQNIGSWFPNWLDGIIRMSEIDNTSSRTIKDLLDVLKFVTSNQDVEFKLIPTI